MQRSRVARNAYARQSAAAAHAVAQLQQRHGLAPGERLEWCAKTQQQQVLIGGEADIKSNHVSCSARDGDSARHGTAAAAAWPGTQERLRWCAKASGVSVACSDACCRAAMEAALEVLFSFDVAEPSTCTPKTARCRGSGCRLRRPDDEAVYKVLVEGGLGGSEWNQWTLHQVLPCLSPLAAWHPPNGAFRVSMH